LLKEILSMEKLPDRAESFHTERESLLGIAHRLTAWHRWLIRDGDIQSFEIRARKMLECRGPLTEVCETALQLEYEVSRIENQTADPLTSDQERLWLSSRSREWTRRLHPIGRISHSSENIRHEQETLSGIREDMDLTRNVLESIIHLRRLLEEGKGSDVDRQVVAGRLPDISRGLEGKRAEQGVAEELKGYEKLLNPPRPAVLKDLDESLLVVKRWTDLLPQDESRINPGRLKGIESRLEEAQQSGRLTEPVAAELYEETRALIADFEKAALIAIGKVREQLIQDRDLVASVKISHGKPMEEIEALEIPRSLTPEVYQQWIERHDRLRSDLNQLSSRSLSMAEDVIRGRVEALSKDLAKALAGLPSANRSIAEEMKKEIDLLPSRIQSGPLDVLRACENYRHRIQELENEARAAVDEFEQFLEGLDTRITRLAALTKDREAETRDLQSPLTELKKRMGSANLESRRREADELSGEVESQERDFAIYCGSRCSEIRHRLEPLLSFLRDLPFADLPEEPAHPGENSDPELASRTLLDHEALETSIRTRFEESLSKLRNRLQIALEALEAIDPSVLDAGETHSLRTMKEEAWELDQTGGESAIRGARALMGLVRRAEDFKRRYYRRREKLQDRLRRVQDRRNQFRDQGYEAHCPPELCLRVSGLIDGIPKSLTSLETLEAQIGAAESLLTALEGHAGRFLAYDTRRRVEVLRSFVDRKGNGSDSEEAAKLLDELSRAGSDMPPPYSLRYRLEKATDHLLDGA
jgi:hypothetical protein